MKIQYFSLCKWSLIGWQYFAVPVSAEAQANGSIATAKLISWDRHEQAILVFSGNTNERTAEFEQQVKHSYMISIQAELSRRLSADAEIFLPNDDGFQAIDTRYTQYRRPTYAAAVRAKNEQDIIETVRGPLTNL